MITEDRFKHMIGVARECYKIAKEAGYTETFARQMYIIGFIHDIGYEFSSDNHEEVGAEMLKSARYSEYIIERHGKECPDFTITDYILNKADMTIDGKGNKVTVEERLKDIEARYGKDSNQYLSSLKMIEQYSL